MTTWFVSRHQGACNWLAEQGHVVDRRVAHLELAQLQGWRYGLWQFAGTHGG